MLKFLNTAGFSRAFFVATVVQLWLAHQASGRFMPFFMNNTIEYDHSAFNRSAYEAKDYKIVCYSVKFCI